MSRKNIVSFVVIGLGVILVLVTAILLTHTATAPSAAADATPGDVFSAPNGSLVEFVGQVAQVNGNTLTVEVLESSGADNVFDQRTGQFIYVVENSTPEFVMGTADDIFVGALAQFRGTKIDSNHISVDRIVILTGYVTGPGGQ